jgi:hypothetical protein
MNLQDQLNAKADKKLEAIYSKLFNNFILEFRKATGINLDSEYTAPPEFKSLIAGLRIRYWVGGGDGQKAFEVARAKHREMFTAEFIRKVEEAQEFLEGQ